MDKLKPCIWCGGEMIEEGGTVNNGKHTMTLRLHCAGCGTKIQFRCYFVSNPLKEAIVLFNRRNGGAE